MRRAFLFSIALLAASCRPEFGERESHVAETRALAMRLEPPEAKPGELVTATLLLASAAGTIDAPVSWAFCATPKLLTDNGAVSEACLEDGVAPIGEARTGVAAPLPSSACFDFGPETHSADVRPRDPDVTGGYYAPLRARVAPPGEASFAAFGFPRITCNLGSAPAEIAALFSAQYVRNKNPTLLPLEARLDSGTPVSLDAVPPGASLVLRASWRPEDAETYPVFDVRDQVLVSQRESMRASWFATAGTFDHDRTGRAESDLESWTDNAWTAPLEARTTHLWVVLRDARGGTAFASFTIITHD